MIDDIENKKKNLQLQKCSLKLVILEVNYFTRNMYEMETITSGLRYIEDLFLENNLVWFWNSLDVQLPDSSVELYNILSYSMFFFYSLLQQF